VNLIYDVQEGIEGIPKKNNTTHLYQDLLKKSIYQIELEFKNKNIKFNSTILDNNKFEGWLEKVNFPQNYNKYHNSFVKAYRDIFEKNKVKGNPFQKVYQKYFEQYIATKVMLSTEMNGVMDIACDKCPFVSYAADLYGAKNVIAQDLTSVPKKHDYLNSNKNVKVIICNATNIPLDNDSLDFICLLNSWEHFQAPADFDVLKESLRLLRPNGKLLIIPLNLFSKSFVSTDPSCWENKQVYKKGQQPSFRRNIPVNLSKNKQVYAQCHSPKLIEIFLDNLQGFSCEINKYSIDDSKYKIEPYLGIIFQKQ